MLKLLKYQSLMFPLLITEINRNLTDSTENGVRKLVSEYSIFTCRSCFFLPYILHFQYYKKFFKGHFTQQNVIDTTHCYIREPCLIPISVTRNVHIM